MLESGLPKCLVFAHHKVILDAVEAACRKGKVGFMRIDGTVPPEKRQARVRQFQEDEACRVAVLSIQAAGTGLTLTASSFVVFAEMTWVPGEMLQARTSSFFSFFGCFDPIMCSG